MNGTQLAPPSRNTRRSFGKASSTPLQTMLVSWMKSGTGCASACTM